MEIWGILWDLDGVLVDTRDVHYRTWKQLLGERGINLTYEDFRSTFGMKNADFLHLWLGRELEPLEAEEISNAKEVRFRRAARGQVQALPGVQSWLEQFRTWGFPQAVASSADIDNIEMLVDELGIRRYFAALVSAYAWPGKPDPAVFLEAARRIDMPPQQCLVIEDSVPGVEAARRAGMKCLAVTTTYPATALGAASIVVERLEHLAVSQLQALLDSQSA